MRDPYDVLAVSRTASAEDIKRAFRRLAKRHHPDANKNDPKAASRFAELNAAYEILGDETKRREFDRGEIDAEGKPRFRGFEGFGAEPSGQEGAFETFTFGPEGFRRGGPQPGMGAGGFEDILKDMFGSATRRGRAGATFDPDNFGPTQGEDVAATLTISLTESATGASKRVRLSNGKEVDVRVPAGVADGQQLRLKGQGMSGFSGGPAGDLLLTIAIAPHPRFIRDGLDLRLDLPVTLYEAVGGGKVRVPTLTGSVELTVPPRTSSGRTFRLRGKGLKAKSKLGDLYVTVQIVLPDDPDPRLDDLMRDWRERRPYDPRRD